MGERQWDSSLLVLTGALLLTSRLSFADLELIDGKEEPHTHSETRKSSHGTLHQNGPRSGALDLQFQTNDILLHPTVLKLCDPPNLKVEGLEGTVREGILLEKVYILVTSPMESKHQKTFFRYPVPVLSCNYTFTAPSLPSLKMRTYPEIVEIYKQIHRSKSGMNHFKMLPTSLCGSDDVSPHHLSRMIKLGEFLAERYVQKLPILQQVSDKEQTYARCMPEQKYFQSMAALLHGLLTEKQFMKMQIQKLTPHISRGLNTHCWHDNISHLDALMQKSYKDEHEIFKDHDITYADRKDLYVELGVDGYHSAKTLLHNLSPWLCELQHVPCDHTKSCLNMSMGHISKLLAFASEHNEYLSSNTVFISYAVADTHAFFSNLLMWFLDGEFSNQNLKIDVVDDFFMTKLLSVLGFISRTNVVSGSRLVIEQYKKTSSHGRVKYWKVLFNGAVITESLLPCRHHSSVGLCGAETVQEYWQELSNNNIFSACILRKEEL